SIHLIAGTDLATAQLDPHEFLAFLGGRLSREFVVGAEDLERRVRELDLGPDPDGRYRVNEFFCHDDTWRLTVTRLAAVSDAALMDLRGFSRAHEGCVFELAQLIDVVPLGRVVLAVDDTSDERALGEVLETAWGRMGPASPNRRVPVVPLRVLRMHGRDE